MSEQQSGMVVRPGAQVARPEVVLKGFLETRIDHLAQWVKGRVDPASLIRFALLEYSQSEQLQRCSRESIYLALIACAQVGLEPGGVKQEAYIVPFKGEATFMAGYRGLIKLALRSRAVKTLSSHLVYQGDEFEIELGSEPRVHHKVALEGRGELLGAYAIAKMENGEFEVEWMSLRDLERVRASAKRGDKESPAYRDWADQMYRKAPIRRLCKRLPLGEDYFRAATLDETAETGDGEGYRRVLDVDVGGDVAPPSPQATPPARGVAAAKAQIQRQTAAAPVGESAPPPKAEPSPPGAPPGVTRGPEPRQRRETKKGPGPAAPPATPTGQQALVPPKSEEDHVVDELRATIAALTDNPGWLEDVAARVDGLRSDHPARPELDAALATARAQIEAEQAAADEAARGGEG